MAKPKASPSQYCFPLYVFPHQQFKKHTLGQPRAGTLEIVVDWPKLIEHLGTKAAFNCNRRTKFAFGIKAKFTPDKEV